MLVAALQFDVRRGEVERNLAEVEAGLRRAAGEGCRLVCLPEMWPTSFAPLEHDGPDLVAASVEAVRRLAALSAELELVVCGSAYAPGPPGALPTNRLHVLDAGRSVLEFDKVHLFSATGETEGFTAGESPPDTVETGAGRLSGVVCYDLRFGPLLRVPFLARAEILVVCAQWPTPRAAHWRALVCGRAVENQCFVLATNRTGEDLVGRRRVPLAFPGNSLLVAPSGEVLAEGRGAAGLVSAEVECEEARRMRRTVSVERDQRVGLYARWQEESEGISGPSSRRASS